MSYSSLYRVSKTRAVMLFEYGNGFGSGPAIWSNLCRNVLKIDENKWIFGKCPDLWTLTYDPKLSLHWRLALSLTLDGAIVKPSDLEEMANACEKVGEEIATETPQIVNHWKSIGSNLRDLITANHYRCLGYAINCTSVSDIWSDYSYNRGKTRTPFDCVEYAKNTD